MKKLILLLLLVSSCNPKPTRKFYIEPIESIWVNWAIYQEVENGVDIRIGGCLELTTCVNHLSNIRSEWERYESIRLQVEQINP